MVFRPISWLYLADLGVSFRWVQGDAFLDILSGNWRHSRELPPLERVTTRSTWVDNRDIYAELNRVVRERWPDRHRHHGLIRPDPTPSPAPPPPPPRPPSRPERSTDFVRTSS